MRICGRCRTLEQRFAKILADAAPTFHAPTRLNMLLRSARVYVAGEPGPAWIESWLRGSEWPTKRDENGRWS